jgi:hypothetical protein
MPKVQVAAVVAFAVLMISKGGEAAEGEGFSAKRLCESCEAVARTTDKSITHSSPEAFAKDVAKTMRCVGFVDGFLAGWTLRIELPITAYHLSKEERAQMISEASQMLQSPFCLPPQGLSEERVIDAYVGYCKLKPPAEEDTARLSLVLALTEAFPPCPSSGEK